MNRRKPGIAVIAALMMASMNVHAGVYADELSKCLVEKTTTQDRTVLVTWVFTALSRHPAVKPIISVSADRIEEVNKNAAALFTRLLTETCRDETVKAGNCFPVRTWRPPWPGSASTWITRSSRVFCRRAVNNRRHRRQGQACAARKAMADSP